MKKTRFIATILALCMVLALCPAQAEDETVYVENAWNYVDGSMDVSGGIPDNATGVLARIKERGVLRVATEPYYAPQEFIDPDLEGQDMYAGSDMKLARLIAERMGVELEIVAMDFTEVLRATTDDQCDLAISALSFVPSRASSNELSKGYFFTDAVANNTMIIRAEDAEKIQTIDDLKDKVLVAQRGSLQEALTVENVFYYREFRRVGQNQDVYDAVMSGAADAGTVDMENAENYIRNNPNCGLAMVDGIRFKLEAQYEGDRIAAKKGELQLMYFVNGVIDEVMSTGEYYRWYEEAAARAEELGL